MESNSNSGGFSFSQDFSHGFSQQSFGGDSTWCSDSQSLSGQASSYPREGGSQPITGLALSFPRESGSQPFTGHALSYPRESGSQSQTFEGRPISSEAKKSKYTLPKWSRALMNTAEENQRKKDLELAVKNLEEDNRQIKAALQEQNSLLKSFPKLVQEMVKESTDYIVSNLNKSVEKCHAELLQKTSSQHQELKDQNDNQLFEVLAVIAATKETLLAKLEQKTGFDGTPIISSLDEMKVLVSKQIESNENELKPNNQTENPSEILAVVAATKEALMSKLNELTTSLNELKQIVFAAKEAEDANGIKFDPNPSLCSTPNLLKDDGELLRSSVSRRKLLRDGNEDDGELVRSSVSKRKLLRACNEDDGEVLRSSVPRRKLLRDAYEFEE